jgi:hypothetical protein
MSARIIRIPELPRPDAEGVTVEAEALSAGWDPYEVWRTRVLLPRLEESQAEPLTPARPSKRSVLKRLRRAKD